MNEELCKTKGIIIKLYINEIAIFFSSNKKYKPALLSIDNYFMAEIYNRYTSQRKIFIEIEKRISEIQYKKITNNFTTFRYIKNR
ncbi:hypothetical protein BpHYR1_004958 [Brachionus plicatilis]|uniref:Uncharacterized protein n=1 Tax=Brachionus plicatilis TaxID=10195 RepID=A0A3M7RJC4_BRAPC|nr:hypothetical protein BpHYR1_004958 [Brachionus plicatilis]